MHPLALLATEVTTGTSPSNTSVTSQIPNDFIFTMDMYNGLDNSQVKMLQVFLNGDSRTVVNQSGPGSAGNETTYFGNATENAVSRFQTIYKSVILDPIGFSSPTGIIGPRSRSVLNKILDNLRNGRPADTNVFVGAVVSNTTTSTSGTVPNDSLFQTVLTSTTTINTGTSTNDASTTIDLQITTTSIPQATVGTPYFAIIEGLGGTSSYEWSVLYGSLPNGITTRTSTCVASPCKTPLLITGTPTSAGSYTFIIKLKSGSTYVSKEVLINIQDKPGTITQNPTAGTNTTGLTTTSSTTISSSRSSSSGSNVGVALGILGGAVAVSAIASSLSSSGSSESSGSKNGKSSGMRDVFGGKITYVQYCTCTDYILLFIYDFDIKSVIQMLYIPGMSTLYSDYNVFEAGPQVLGGYIRAQIPCWIIAGDDCAQFGSPIGYIDTLRGVGTTAQ